MKINKHKRFKNMSNVKKRLEMKINQHKMLMNTLHDLLRRDNVAGDTITLIKCEIDSTLKEIEELRKESEREENTANSVNIFDSISKPGKCCSSTCTCRHSINTGAGFYDSIFKENKTVEQPAIIQNVAPSKPSIHDAIFCDRFLVDLTDLSVPAEMVKSVDFIDSSRSRISVGIYDFVVKNGYEASPVAEILEKFMNRKFTMTISHLGQTGAILYKEKYVGCIVSELFRSPLNYEESNPSTINILINYDGVSYETAN
jgi:hypothetical protein